MVLHDEDKRNLMRRIEAERIDRGHEKPGRTLEPGYGKRKRKHQKKQRRKWLRQRSWR